MTNESDADFQIIFEALKTYNLAWKPTVLLADASAAITAGFRKVFGNPKIRITCFFHVLKNLERLYAQLRCDIRNLQVCGDSDVFRKADTSETCYCTARGKKGTSGSEKEEGTAFKIAKSAFDTVIR